MKKRRVRSSFPGSAWERLGVAGSACRAHAVRGLLGTAWTDPEVLAAEKPAGAWELFRCPADPAARQKGSDSPALSYVVNCGKPGDRPGDLRYARPASNHPGGVNAVFCDGHSYFLSEQIDYQVYEHMMTPDSRKAGVSGEFDPADL